MSRLSNLPAQNLRLGLRKFGPLARETRQALRVLTTKFSLSIAAGELTFLEGKWYVTHSGLLQIARRHQCSGIETRTVPQFCDPGRGRWIVKATVYKTAKSKKGFVGYGDADPSNVGPVVRGAELRVAETRAVNRALRKAYGIGLCSVEELGAGPITYRVKGDNDNGHDIHNGSSGNGHPRLRDRLLILIRQHQLDAERVKRYAANFCGTTSLREASREQVERVVDHLEGFGRQGREKLLEALNGNEQSCGQVVETQESAPGQLCTDNAGQKLASNNDNGNTHGNPCPAAVPKFSPGRSRRRTNKEAAA